MFPVWDAVPTPTKPIGTLTLIALMLVAFIGLPAFGTAGIGSTTVAPGWLPDVLNRVLTMVWPADWLMTAASCLALWLFGPVVEDRLGRVRFILLFVMCGFAADLCVRPSGLPLTHSGPGAALAGVIAARLALYPRGRTIMLVPEARGLDFVDVHSALVAGFWMLAHVVSTGAHLQHSGGWTLGAAVAHALIGAAFGAALVHVLKRPRRMRTDWWNRAPAHREAARVSIR